MTVSIHRPVDFAAGKHISNRLTIPFLPRDARSAKHGIAIVSRPSVRPCICDADVPWAYVLG